MSRKYLTPIDLNQLELQNARIQNLGTAPSSPVEGQIYYNTGDDTFRLYTTAGWVTLSPETAAQILAKLVTVDGAGSGLDADLLDGQSGAYHLDRTNHTGTQSADTIVDGSTNHVFTAADDTKLTGIATGATANDTDANLRARSSHTGTQAASTISDFDTQVRTSRLDQMAAPTAAVAMNNQKITGLGTPTADTDAATKTYVDSARQGLDVKDSVRAASTANVAVTYDDDGGLAGTGQITGAPTTLDGVTLVANDRILLKDQSAGAENGIWVVTTLGSGANGVWDRAIDFNRNEDVTAGAYIFVSEGTAQADSGWVLTTNDPIVLGTATGTSLTFVQFSGAGQITAGAGLTKTGNTLAAGAGTGITVNADDIAIDTAVVVRKFAQDVGDGASTAIVVTHNLNTRDVTVGVREAGSPWAYVECDIEATSVNTVTLRFAVAPASSAYRVVIHA